LLAKPVLPALWARLVPRVLWVLPACQLLAKPVPQVL